MTEITNCDHSNADIHKILEQRGEIAIIWSIADIQIMRPDLDDAQAWYVLESCSYNHDCGLGFTWDLIEATAEHLYPEGE